MSVLSQISNYRELRQKRDAGAGMSMDEVLMFEALAVFLRKGSNNSSHGIVSALLSTNTIEQAVMVKRLGPDSVVCTGCPGVLPSSSFGLRLDDTLEQRSYLYRVVVSAITYVSMSEDCEVEFEFVGGPVILNWGRGRSSSPDAVVELENKLCAA